MILLSSDLREGIDHSHPKTVQKMENNNCSYTEENQHIFQGREQSYFSITKGRAITVSPYLQSKGFMQCPTSNGNPLFMNFCSPPRPDISSWSKTFCPFCFLCASQMAPRGYREKPARNVHIYEVRLRWCKPNKHVSNCFVYCGIPFVGEEEILAPYFGDVSTKNFNFKKSFKNWRQESCAKT